MKRWILVVPICVALLGLLATEARAVPTTLHFTGRVSDGGGPINDAVPMTFKFFDVESIGTGVELWSQSFAALIANEGLVTVELGTVVGNELDETVFDGGDVYLEITVDSVVQSPRIRVGSVPYAIHAGVADICLTDDVLSEAEVDAYVANNGYSTGAHTVDTNLSEAEVDAYVANNNYSTGPHTLDTNTQLSEAQVDAYVANNNYSTGAHVTEATVDAWANNNGYGDISSVTAGAGLSGGALSGAVTLSVDTDETTGRAYSYSPTTGNTWVRSVEFGGAVEFFVGTYSAGLLERYYCMRVGSAYLVCYENSSGTRVYGIPPTTYTTIYDRSANGWTVQWMKPASNAYIDLQVTKTAGSGYTSVDFRGGY